MDKITTVEQWLGKDNRIGIDIWSKKYCYNNESFIEWLERVSGNNGELKQLILEKKFLFGGRILSNRGLNKKGLKVSLSNCYVISPPDDNIESIFDCAKKLARTFSYGGGCGIDISKLAPKNSKVNNTAKITSGSVSFMDLYSLTTELIGQNGRRGALMISLDCNHPDLEDFIGIKSELNKITKANISIKITDEFMNAVKNKQEYELSFIRPETGEVVSKVIDANKLFKRFVKINWDYAEPGVLFWDRIKNYNLLSHNQEFEFAGINPCGEEPLPSGGSCLLGSINLSEFIKDGIFDYDDFKTSVDISVKALNIVLEEGLSLHPLKEQKDSVRDWKQIGLGIMGLADCLIKMGIKYGSESSIQFCDKIGLIMMQQAILTSSELAKEYGKYPKCNAQNIVSTDFFKTHENKELKSMVETYGLYNSQLLTCAPTGTLSTMLGISGGIEPIFANSYTRKTESLHGKDVEYKVYTPIVKEYMENHNISDDKSLPEYFITSQEINFKSRVNMQSIWQKHIDASISSTINLPVSATIDDIEEFYIYAWEQGLKGATIYRSGCKREGILTTTGEKQIEEKQNELDCIVPISRNIFGKTIGTTNKYKTACGSLYITINRDKDGNIIETFVNVSKNGICKSNIDGISRMVSVALRSGTAVEEVVDQLKGINCAACSRALAKGEKLDGISCPDILSKAIQNEYDSDEIYIKKTKRGKGRKKIKPVEREASEKGVGGRCSECDGELKFEGGCVVCLNCGWSRCS